ncbi:MAG: MarR family winged helix-turn-helix transcriptional regulator [Candidatus Kapaibacterium sp.]
MKKAVPRSATKESRNIMDDIRRLVQAIRLASSDSEKQIGLSAAQLFVLHKLSEEQGLSINDLAERTMTHQSSVSVVVQKLEAKGLLKRLVADHDGRKFKLSLTKKGMTRMKKAPSAVQDTLIGALEKLEPKMRKNFATGFSSFLRLAGIEGEAPLLFAEDKSLKRKKKISLSHGPSSYDAKRSGER